MSEPVFDIQGPDDFRARVLGARGDVLMVVDFWAPWCAPCRALTPVLERVVASLQGRAALAKVNIDENPELAAQHDVRGVPAVKFFRAGQPAGGFTGALPEPKVRAALAAAMPSEADERAARGDALLAGGDPAGAEADWRKALELDPRHAAARLRLARAALARGEAEAARALLAGIPPGAAERTEADALEARLAFAAGGATRGGLPAIREKLAAAPDDLELRYELGLSLAAAGQYAPAMDAFLAVLERDRAFRDGAARDAILRVFSVVGPRSPLAEDYRARLARILFA
jgi:putative thioredoxin